MIRLIYPLVIVVLSLTGCDDRTPPIHAPANIESEPSLLKKYLDFELPKTAVHLKIQSIAGGDEKYVELIARFEINIADLERLVQDFQMVKSDDALATVPAAPLIHNKPNIAWWNPPIFTAQLGIETRYFKSLKSIKQQTDDGYVSLVWIDGIAYVYKTGPF